MGLWKSPGRSEEDETAVLVPTPILLHIIEVMSDKSNAQEDKTRLISLPEASKLYGISHSYLRSIAKNGRLQAQKVGNSWVTTPNDVEEYIASRKRRGVYRTDL